MNTHDTLTIRAYVSTLPAERQRAIMDDAGHTFTDYVQLMTLYPFWAKELRELHNLGVERATEELRRRGRRI